MALTKKQADALDGEAQAVSDAAAELEEALANLTTGGESDDREEDSGEVLTAYLELMAKVDDLKATAGKYRLEA